jgi:hypothetical protein
MELRKLAVETLKSSLNIQELILYLPQLLQALKYEHTNNSALAKMLLQSAAENVSFAHRLYW